jgi:hypothetical protein
MKNKFIVLFLFAGFLLAGTSCKKYLNINTDPANPQNPSNSSVFPAMLAGIPRGIQYDSRYLGKYIQNWNANSAADTWDRMGYLAGSDASGDVWRQTYFGLGMNLDYIIQQGIKTQQYDFVAACYALKAYMFQICTDYHGEIIFSEAFDDQRAYFDYDTQDVIYKGIDSLCRLSLKYNDLAIGKTNHMVTADFTYTGDMGKWRKMVYATLAHNWGHLTNKASYNADSVISFCNKAFASTDDDFVIPFDATKNDDANFYGAYRNNIGLFRQSNFIVSLLDGTTLAGSNTNAANRDPRMRQMLSVSEDTTNGNGGYRGVDAGIGDPYNSITTGANARKRVAVLWGDSLHANPSASAFTKGVGKYLFKDNAVMPVMTYSELQFIKAEAYFRKADKAGAYTAYLAGINGHFDFINRNYSGLRGDANLYTGAQLSAAERNKYLAGANVKQNAGSLTLTDIMLQKYIALWGWGWEETWVDLRRYHYNVDPDPTTNVPVYNSFVPPASLFPSNNGKLAYRVRPRYNSEYVWNVDALTKIGGFNPDYHTYECWFSKP